MLVCPLDYRYGSEEMRAIFSEETKLETLLRVEAALATASAGAGKFDQRYADEIARCATTERVTLERVKAIEAEIKHDLMAVVVALTEQCSDAAGKYVHLGATSNDIIDTATALQLGAALDILETQLETLEAVLLARATEHRETVMLGRTHGQAALPITFGLKLAVYAAEVQRHLARLEECRKRVCVGKLSGAVGTGAALGDPATAETIEADAMDRLGLTPALATGQIVGRDRYAELVAQMATLASTLDKFGTEIRNLQRNEIAEAAEAFDIEKQVGSSTMAQKRNPISSENVCGLARIVRGFVTAALENIPLWHERDLTNSSAERFILPHVCIIVDHMLRKMAGVFRNLAVDAAKMRANLDAAGATIMAEPIMIALVERGLGRQNAHERVRKCAQRARERATSFVDELEADPVIADMLARNELEELLEPSNYLGRAHQIIDAVAAHRRTRREARREARGKEGEEEKEGEK